MGYPVSYRTGSEKYSAVSRRGLQSAAQTAANDNSLAQIVRNGGKEALARAANDNGVRLAGQVEEIAARRAEIALARRVGTTVLTKVLTRGIPIVGEVLLAADLIELATTRVERVWIPGDPFPFDPVGWVTSTYDPIASFPGDDYYLSGGATMKWSDSNPGTRFPGAAWGAGIAGVIGGDIYIGQVDTLNTDDPPLPSFMSPNPGSASAPVITADWQWNSPTPPEWIGTTVEVPGHTLVEVPQWGTETVTGPDDWSVSRTSDARDPNSDAGEGEPRARERERPRERKQFRRARRNEKERKFRSSRGVLALLKVLGEVTELVDGTKDIWEAIPEEYRTGYYRIHVNPKALHGPPGAQYLLTKDGRKIPVKASEADYGQRGRGGVTIVVKRFHASPLQQARDIYRHWDKVDVNQALKNIMWDQAQDFFYGKVGQASNKASERSRPHGDLPIGYQAGHAMDGPMIPPHGG